MKTYAVGHINWFDNKLEIKIVRAESKAEALRSAFPDLASSISEENINLETNMEDAKQHAFNMDCMFEIKEVE